VRVQALPGRETGLGAQSVSDVTVGVEQQRRLDFTYGDGAPSDDALPQRESTVWGEVPGEARVALALNGSEIMRDATIAGPDGSYRIDLKLAERTKLYLIVELPGAKVQTVRGRLYKKRRFFRFQLDPGQSLQLNPDLALRDSVEGVIDPPTAGVIVSAIAAKFARLLVPGGGRALTDRDWPESATGMNVFEAETDSDGRFRIAVPKKAIYTLLSFEGNACLTPQTGEAGSSFRLAYAPAHPVEIRVTACDTGQPVPRFRIEYSARVRAWSKNDDNTAFVLSNDRVVEAGTIEGRNGVARIRCRLPYEEPNLAPTIIGRIIAPGFQPEDIHGQRLLLLLPSPAPAPNLTVQVQTPAGEPYDAAITLWAARPRATAVPTTSTRPGVVETRLTGGTWRLEPRVPDAIGIRVEALYLTLAETPQTHRITLPPGAPLRIENHTGGSIQLHLRRPDEAAHLWNRTVNATRFEVPYIAEGEWLVGIVGSTAAPKRIRIVSGVRHTLRFP